MVRNGDPNEHLIKQLSRTLQNVLVAERYGIECAGINNNSHLRQP
jgi:hypothetical protein